MPRMQSKSLLLRLAGLLVAVLFCFALSLRPIPGLRAPNDTGRYVASFRAVCELGSSAARLPVLDHPFFNFISRLLCWSGEPRVWLFLLGVAVPFTLISFGEWNRDSTFVVAVSYLFSSIGFELMTNAMRQGLSLAFFLAALSCRWRAFRLLALGIALLLHDSSWVFLPLLLLLNREAFPSVSPDSKPRVWTMVSKTKLISALSIPVLAAAALYIILIRFGSLLSTGTLFDFYFESYSMEASKLFLIFMILPVCWIFTVRVAEGGGGISRAEKQTFYYSIIVFLLTMAIFPAITYRFTMTAMVLQMFMAMRADRLSLKSGGLIAAGLVVHFLIYALASANVRAVLHG